MRKTMWRWLQVSCAAVILMLVGGMSVLGALLGLMVMAVVMATIIVFIIPWLMWRLLRAHATSLTMEKS